jgi:formate hydrogenlyase transcriptional activator
VRRHDGEYRWFLMRFNPVRDEAGRLVRWYGTRTDIDDLKRAEERVRHDERELRQIVDLVPHHIAVVTPDGTGVYGNQVMLDYYGVTLEDVSGALIRRFAHPDDVDTFLAAWERGFSGTAAWETEARFRRRDGEYRWFLVRVIPLRDDAGRIVRWYATGTDIDDRKRAEERVRQDERELRMIVDFLPQHLVVADAQGGVVYANRVALEFTGRTLEETVAHPEVWSEIVHPDDLPTMQATIRGLAEGIGREIEFRLRRPDGEYRWILGRHAPLRDAEGRVIGWFAAGTDIDDRKRAEQRMHDENLALREEVDKASMFEEIVGTSPALRAVLTSVAQVAPTDSTVLITGETGTGKELVARAIHKRSPRAPRAFVSVNCAAIPLTLIASELFGHEKGAFTGALQRRAGRFELADGGTIFLDEVGDLPPDTQLALLRVLQEREFERVGSTRPIKVDVRVIAATNRDLNAAIEGDAFRTDLFYRLNVFPIEVPPLRERPSDIPLLVAYFVERYARNAGKTIRHVEKRTLQLVQSYRWPGNVRELQNVIERAVIICESETLNVDPSWLARQTAPGRLRPFADELAARERQMIEAALAESNGRVSGPTGAAVRLGMPGSTLESKIRALGIRKHRFKGS